MRRPVRKDLIRGEWVMCDQKWPCEWNKESGQQCFDDGATIYAPGQQWHQADIALDNISDTCLSSNNNGSSIEMGERLKVSVGCLLWPSIEDTLAKHHLEIGRHTKNAFKAISIQQGGG